MVSDDKYIELIVAGINRLTMTGAEVKWNVNIDTRQFDVLATIQTGGFKVLVGFEVKNKSRPVGVEMMDAFVTKTKDSKIHKAVFVSTSGYQSGAIKVAQKHDVSLFELTFIEDESPKIPETMSYITISDKTASKEPIVIYEKPRSLAHAFVKATIKYSDGKTKILPTEPSQMTYYVQKTKVVGHGSIDKIIADNTDFALSAGEKRTKKVVLNSFLEAPDNYFFHSGQVESLIFEVEGVMARVLTGNTKIELSMFSCPVKYVNVLTGDTQITDIYNLPMGEDKLIPGNYYFGEFPLRYYYCEKIVGTKVHVFLVESFQNGELFQAEMTQDLKYSCYYIPLIDKKIVSRLQSRLEKLIRRD